VSPSLDEQGLPGDLVIYAGPGRASGRRGVSTPGARLPIFGARHAPGCSGSWWLVGPLSWVCSDRASLSPDEPSPPSLLGNPLSTRYFFVSPSGASAYGSFASAQEGDSDRELEGGWGVAVAEERSAPDGTHYGRTTKGAWIGMRDLSGARPSSFRGDVVKEGRLDFGWVVAERVRLWSAQKGAKIVGTLDRLDRIDVLQEDGRRVRVDADQWLDASDLARPRLSLPPAELARPDERWIDVDLATQTLVAYEGATPVYATLVSTGRGRPGSESATPPGVHRIWVKLLASDMDNVERDDVESHYSLQDVPYVQYFDHAVGLHGVYWHRDFGRVKSHGCVNLAPLDAKWLFEFTQPHLPPGWGAVLPTDFEPGTVVRVR
jgi:hypothetical protein